MSETCFRLARLCQFDGRAWLGAMLVFAALHAPALAQEAVGVRHITGVGCHHVNGTCFVSLDGPAFGGTLGCPAGAANEIRFDDGDTAIGRRTYASFLAAFLSGKPVLTVVNGCSSQGVASLHYFWVYP